MWSNPGTVSPKGFTTILQDSDNMTYQELCEMKLMRHSTVALAQKFPGEREKIAKIALCDIPDDELKRVLEDKPEILREVLMLKECFNLTYKN